MMMRAAATNIWGAGQLHTAGALMVCASSSVLHLVWQRLLLEAVGTQHRCSNGCYISGA